MARFNVGDRVTWGRDVCEVVLADRDAAQRIIIMDDRGRRWTAPEQNLTLVPPPDPRDAVVEAAVAWAVELRPSSWMTDASRDLYDAVQAWKATQ